MKEKKKLAISLNNFAYDFVCRKETLEDIMKIVAELGYQGVEITPAQVMPSYPDMSEQSIKWLKGLLTKYQLEPVCWNIFLDTGVNTGRDFSENEIQKTILQNLIYAKKSGFPLVKTTTSIPLQIFQKTIPICRDFDMRLALDLTELCDYENSAFKDFTKVIRSAGNGYVGLITDLTVLSNTNINSKELLDISFGIYCQPEMTMEHDELLKKIEDTGLGGYLICREKEQFTPETKIRAKQFVQRWNTFKNK